jgi:hypothetical protein
MCLRSGELEVVSLSLLTGKQPLVVLLAPLFQLPSSQRRAHNTLVAFTEQLNLRLLLLLQCTQSLLHLFGGLVDTVLEFVTPLTIRSRCVVE